MDKIKSYLEMLPFLKHDQPKKSRFEIDETMIPMFCDAKKGIPLNAKKAMQFRFLNVEDHIIPIYPLKEKPIREKLENISLSGEFNLRDEIKKVTFKEVEDEIEAVEYDVKKIEVEEIEQPLIRGEYLYKFFERNSLNWHDSTNKNHVEFQIQGNISADSKVIVVDLSEYKSFNPIKHVRWHKTHQILTNGEEFSLIDPLPLYEGFEWYITREAIGYYLNVVVFRGKNIKRNGKNIIEARDLHFNNKKKSINYIQDEDFDSDNEKYLTEEILLGPVLIPDYIAYQVMNYICSESIFCNIILLDRPRPVKSEVEKEPKFKNEERDKDKNEKFEKYNEKKKELKQDKSDEEDSNDEKNIEDKKNETSEQDDNEKDKKNNESEDDNDDDDDEYSEEDDYLAFKRDSFKGVFESQLMDGYIKISYNTKKDEIKEEKRKTKLIKEKKFDSKDFKTIYHKSIELYFDQFFFIIDHKENKSVVKMIILENENKSYDIKFRIDPEFGRDIFYYTMIAFQGCYRDQIYDWDDKLKNGDIIPIKEFIQQELEGLTLKGYF